MHDVLFTRLWEEVDFDDHPSTAGHTPQPVGELRYKVDGSAIIVSDDRLTFRLGDGDSGEDSIHRWTKTPVQVNDGPERLGVHRWSITPQDLGLSLSAFVAVKIGPPQEMEGIDITSRRELLGAIRNSISPLLEGWSWHLEVDNKADRCGWYIRAPNEWCSLFTIFVGLGWNPATPEETRGFLLFERAPPNELDRPDEAEANRLDGLRTVALCNGQRGALSKLAEDENWAHQPSAFPLSKLTGNVELWPPSMGRWPLLVGRGPSADSPHEIAEWCGELVTTLQPAISTLKARIDGLSWQ